MGGRGDFEVLDRRAAANFADVARLAGVRQIVYLGGLGSGDDLSPHLASRHEVGRTLRTSRIPTVELRASIVIGSGSASFETVRALVEHLPLIVAPRWVQTLAQPIAVEDIVDYLLAVVELDRPTNAIYEVGGDGLRDPSAWSVGNSRSANTCACERPETRLSANRRVWVAPTT